MKFLRFRRPRRSARKDINPTAKQSEKGLNRTTSATSRLGLELKEGTYDRRVWRFIKDLFSFGPPKPPEHVFLEYVAKQLEERLKDYKPKEFKPEEYKPEEYKRELSSLSLSTFMKVDFVWKNHFYIVGKVRGSDKKDVGFGGEIVLSDEKKFRNDDKKFRGEIKLKVPSNETEALDITKDPRWLEYDHHIKLYKDYLDMCLRGNFFFYAITGALLTFVYDDKGRGSDFILALLLPIIMSFSFGVVFLYGAHRWREVTFIIRVLKHQIGIKRAPDVQILSMLLLFSGIITMAVGVVLAIVLAIGTGTVGANGTI